MGSFSHRLAVAVVFFTLCCTATCLGVGVSGKAKVLAELANKNLGIRCEADVSRGDCRSCLNLPHCGYCADDDSCHIGKQSGPLRDVDCKSWHFSKCDALPKCEVMKSCDSCLAHPRCGWCHTEDPSKIGCMPAVVGSDNTFRRNPMCRYGDEKNLWFHTFLTEKRNISNICEGHLPRKEAIDKLEATTYWKSLASDKSKVEEMRKKTLKAQEGDAKRLRDAKKRALAASKEAHKLEGDVEKGEKEMENCASDEKLAKEAFEVKSAKLKDQENALGEKKEKLLKSENNLKTLKDQLAAAQGGNENAAPSATGFLEVTGATVEELKDKISNEEATIDGLKKQVKAAEKVVNGLKEEVATLQQSWADAKSKLETVTKKVKINRARLVVVNAELHAAEGVVNSEKSLASEKGASRKAASREVSAATIAQQQKKEDIEIRMRLDKAEIADTKVENTLKQNMKKVKLLREMLQRKDEMEKAVKNMIANATQHLQEKAMALSNKTESLSSLEKKIENMTANAVAAYNDAKDSQQQAVKYATEHPEDPVKNDKKIEEANEAISEKKENLAFIKSSGALNVTAAKEIVKKAKEELDMQKEYLVSQQEKAKKMKEEFVASEKQQKEIEKAEGKSSKDATKKLEKKELLLENEQKAADEQEAEAQTALQNQASELSNEATDAIEAAEKKAAVDEASAAKLVDSKLNSETNETSFEEEATKMAEKLSDDAKESDDLAKQESEKASVARLPNNSSVKVNDDNKLASTFKRYSVKFDIIANHSSILMNMLKKSLVEVRKTKATVENTTSVNPQDDLANMVLKEVTDSEKNLEITLSAMAKMHQERTEAASDMQERAQKQVGLPVGFRPERAAPTLDEANPNIGAAPVDF